MLILDTKNLINPNGGVNNGDVQNDLRGIVDVTSGQNFSSIVQSSRAVARDTIVQLERRSRFEKNEKQVSEQADFFFHIFMNKFSGKIH